MPEDQRSFQQLYLSCARKQQKSAHERLTNRVERYQSKKSDLCDTQVFKRILPTCTSEGHKEPGKIGRKHYLCKAKWW